MHASFNCIYESNYFVTYNNRLGLQGPWFHPEFRLLSVCYFCACFPPDCLGFLWVLGIPTTSKNMLVHRLTTLNRR